MVIPTLKKAVNVQPPKKQKPAAIAGKRTKEAIRGTPPSAKTVAENAKRTALEKERADVKAADAAAAKK